MSCESGSRWIVESERPRCRRAWERLVYLPHFMLIPHLIPMEIRRYALLSVIAMRDAKSPHYNFMVALHEWVKMRRVFLYSCVQNMDELHLVCVFFSSSRIAIAWPARLNLPESCWGGKDRSSSPRMVRCLQLVECQEGKILFLLIIKRFFSHDEKI